MEPVQSSVESNVEIEQRRQLVALWIQDTLSPVNRLLDSDTLPESDAPRFEVREYQLDAWAALWDARQAGETHGLVHLATGLGKTSVGVFDVMKFREEFRAEHGRDPKIMFAVHQTDILDQAAERFGAFMPEATTSFHAGRKKDMGGDIVFATYQSLHANLDSLDPKAFDYIIDDEVHHAKAWTYEKVVKHFKPEFRLGLTATPNRADGKDIRGIYGQELYSKGLAEALSEGWLATPDYHIVFDDAVKEAMQSGFQPNSLKALKALFNVEPRNDTIADNIREEVKKIGLEFGSVKAIVFCQDIEHAEEMAELLGGKAYHSDTDDKERKNIFDEFKHGDLQVITTRDMFNEGVDVPDARLLVFLRSTSSQTIFEQQLGRGLRKAEGKDRVSVLDFVANVERIAMVKDLAEQVKKPRNPDGDTNSDTGDEGELPTGNINDNTFEPTEDGFVIHTNHGEFDFDKMSVDLLEKYRELKAQGVVNPLNSLSDEELITLARSISPDKPLAQREIDKLSRNGKFISSNTLYRRFGSLRGFYKECGFEVSKLVDLSHEELFELARQISPVKPLSQKLIRELSKEGRFVSNGYIADNFGSLSAFNKACGLSARMPSDMTNEELIEAAKRLSPDKPLRVKDMARLCKERKFVGGDVIASRFGSVRVFQQECGFDSTRLSDMTNAELVGLAKELSHGEPLTKATINRLSQESKFVSASSIDSRFGGIVAFREACGW